jgi:hypothetical protein
VVGTYARLVISSLALLCLAAGCAPGDLGDQGSGGRGGGSSSGGMSGASSGGAGGGGGTGGNGGMTSGNGGATSGGSGAGAGGAGGSGSTAGGAVIGGATGVTGGGGGSNAAGRGADGGVPETPPATGGAVDWQDCGAVAFKPNVSAEAFCAKYMSACMFDPGGAKSRYKSAADCMVRYQGLSDGAMGGKACVAWYACVAAQDSPDTYCPHILGASMMSGPCKPSYL